MVKSFLVISLFFGLINVFSAEKTLSDESSRRPASNAQIADLELLNEARRLFAENKLDEALVVYSKIPASSDFWLDSLEERAWVYTRKSNYEKALGDLKSVANKVWAPQTGPETMMLSAFVSLKICAYKDVLEKIEQFKTRMIPRVESLEGLLERPVTPRLRKHLAQAAKGDLRLSQLGSEAEKFPRYFFRDQELINAFTSNAESTVASRIKTLAERDLEEIQKNLKKMKVIEVEVIQRVFSADELKMGKNKLDFEKYDRSSQVSFPISDDEVWVDEVGSYEVRAQQCPQ